MWAVSSQWGEALASSHTLTAEAAITLEGAALVDTLLPDSWQVSKSLRGDQTESRLDMVVTDPDGSMLSDDPSSPLQAYGQMVAMQVTARSGDWAETIPMGRWRIKESTPTGGRWALYPNGRWRRGAQTVSVSCTDLIGDLAAFDFLGKSAPPAGATTLTELQRLVDGAMPVALDLPSRLVASAPWSGSRIDAILQVVADTGGVADIDRTGVLRPIPQTGTGQTVTVQPADVTGYVDGTATGLISWSPKASRDGIANGVVLTGQRPDGVTLYGRALESEGPTAWSAARFGRVTHTEHSALLITQAAVDAAAKSRLAALSRARAQTLEVQLMPNPAIDVLDTCRIMLPDADRALSGLITSVTIGSHGPMTLQVSIPHGQAIYGG